MCGFTGYVLRSGTAEGDEARLRSMTDTIEHRGPDDEGLFLRGPVAFGFRRLSIIDLAGGHQPIVEPSGVACMGNGEIYNFRELRAAQESCGAQFQTGSDIETILHGYLEHAGGDVTQVARALTGMFAFAIADMRGGEPRLVLGRDRLGIKPLYWAETGRASGSGASPRRCWPPARSTVSCAARRCSTTSCRATSAARSRPGSASTVFPPRRS